MLQLVALKKKQSIGIDLNSGIGSGKKLKQNIGIKAFLMPCDKLLKKMKAKFNARDSEISKTIIPDEL